MDKIANENLLQNVENFDTDLLEFEEYIYWSKSLEDSKFEELSKLRQKYINKLKQCIKGE